MEIEYESYCEVWRITEMRDGAVYKTEKVGKAWVPMGAYGDGVKGVGGLIYAALSTNDPEVNTLLRRKRSGT